MNNTLTNLEKPIFCGIDTSSPSIYLYRHWPNHLGLSEAQKLPTKRLLAYYKKHLYKRNWFKDLSNYKWKKNDLDFNGEWGTNPHLQINEYLDKIKLILNSRENIED